MSDHFHRGGFMPAVEAVVLAVLHWHYDTISSITSGARSNDSAVEGATLRAFGSPITTAYMQFAPKAGERLRNLLRLGQLDAYERSGNGFRQLPTAYWESPESEGVLEEDLDKPVGKPPRHQFFFRRSEIDQLLRSSANISTPPASSDPLPGTDRPSPVTKKPLPAALEPKLADALGSRAHLPRPQQHKEVAASPEFRDYHLTQSVLREAGRVAPKRPGRPRKQQPE
jgi:hypothetical protein